MTDANFSASICAVFMEKLTKTQILIAGFLFGACFVVMVLLVQTLWFSPPVRGRPMVSDSNLDAAPALKAGPWGHLEAFQLPLANPEGVYPDREERMQRPRWIFEGVPAEAVVRFLNSCDLLPFQKKALLDRQIWTITPEACVISPPEQLLWSLGSRAREQIYSVLSRNPANYNQAFPFRFSPAAFDLQFSQTGLPPDRVEVLKRFTYRKSGDLCLSDLEPLRMLLDTADFERVVETLYAVPAWSMRVRVTPDTDIDTVIRYWGSHGRESMIAPLLKALAKVPGGGTINVSYLLPPFARLRLYTYPDSWSDPTAHLQDCFFSSLNFFGDSPNTNFFDPVYTQKVLESEYAEVPDDPAFGDLVVLIDEKGMGKHMCVYLADDFVFTKNGVNHAQPWVIMQLTDMLNFYCAPGKAPNILFLRQKQSPPVEP
jgi:hypothetical protein